MEQEAKEDISDDIIHDSLHDAVCRDCSNARLIDRQRKEISRLTLERDEAYKKLDDDRRFQGNMTHTYCLRMEAAEAQVEALREELRGVIRGER